MPENGTQLWNNQEMLGLINQHKNVVAWISGHHHAGGYHEIENIYHLTMKGMIESPKVSSFGVMEVYSNKLVLKGYGDQKGQILEFSTVH